jgi:hypothetical protein
MWLWGTPWGHRNLRGSMPIPSQPIPQTTYLQQGNKQILLSWSPVAGATNYRVERSLDGITYVLVSSPTESKYLDTSVTANTQYWYRVASENGLGLSNYTYPTPSSIIPVVAGYMSLQQLRTLAQQKSDRVNSNFVTLPEWNSFINLAADELYDLVTTVYEDYQVHEPVYFLTNYNQSSYPLPDGITTFKNVNGSTITPPPIYKLAGIDLGLNNAPNGYVSVQRYAFIDRNKYIFPNTASTIYGVFGLQYRLIGNSIRFIPQPASGQTIGIWYVPRRTQLLQETDTTDGYNGWTNYIITRAAKYDTSKLDAEIIYLKQRIEESASNRDEGQPDTVSDARNSFGFGPDGGGYLGPYGRGW